MSQASSRLRAAAGRLPSRAPRALGLPARAAFRRLHGRRRTLAAMTPRHLTPTRHSSTPLPLAPQPGAKQPTAAEMSEAEQEALLRAKYGGLLKKKPLLPQDRKHFDSADWQLSKQGVPAERPQLEPKLNPTVPPARRSSQLGDGQ